MSRHDRVEAAIKREVSMIIHDRLKDPRTGFVTVTGVELSQDLRHAKIFYSVLGSQEQKDKTRLALDSALGFIRKQVSEAINLKFAPEIIFRPDTSSEYSARIQEVLNEIKELENEPKKSHRKAKKQ